MVKVYTVINIDQVIIILASLSMLEHSIIIRFSQIE